MRDYAINRKIYKDIKKYDCNQMDTFLQSVYKSGYVNGKEDAAESTAAAPTEIDTEELTKRVLTVKGVGVVKAAEIVKIVNEFLGGVY